MQAASRLQEAGITPDALAEYVPERRVLLVRRKAIMRPLSAAWRMGTLLLTTDGTLYAHGHSTRAAERGRPSFQSESREERRELAAAALRGGFPVGTPVDFDAVPLLDAAGVPQGALADLGASVASGALGAGHTLPVGLAEGEVRVCWRAGAPLAGAQTLEAFLTERVGLLIDPPFARE